MDLAASRFIRLAFDGAPWFKRGEGVHRITETGGV
jgi:hypothetical protein